MAHIRRPSLFVVAMHLRWNPSNKETIGTLLSVPNRGVSLIQGLFWTSSYVAGTADGVLIQGCPLRGVPLYRLTVFAVHRHCMHYLPCVQLVSRISLSVTMESVPQRENVMTLRIAQMAVMRMVVVSILPKSYSNEI